MKDISIAGIDRRSLFGCNDQHLAHLEKRYGIRLVARGDTLTLKGADASVREAGGFLSHLIKRMRHGPPLAAAEVEDLITCSSTPPIGDHGTLSNPIAHTYKTAIYARTEGQAKYLAAIDNNDVVFGIGPAGTGKTYLAVAMAVAALRQKQISRILLARPAVEAGEKLGFLPGSFEDKVDPYLRPLYDALQDLMEPERLRRMQDMKIVEVVPLAYMRGRTLNDSFIILDEAQNTTPQQMKMFLTRLGSHSKAVVTGDITQTDLSDDQPSGLVVAPKILTGIAGLAFVRLNERDVVRNPLVQKIIKAYDSYEEVHDSADS